MYVNHFHCSMKPHICRSIAKRISVLFKKRIFEASDEQTIKISKGTVCIHRFIAAPPIQNCLNTLN